MRTEQMDQIQIAQELFSILELRKEVEKKEKELKESIKAIMGDEKFLDAGNVVITLAERTRTDLDKKGLLAQFGDAVKAFEKVTTFQVMNVVSKG